MYINNSFFNLEDIFLINKNSHAYIFYTNNFDKCQKDVYELVKKIFNVDSLNRISSDFIVIPKSERKSILKDDMQDLRSFFQKTTYLNKKRLYLIEELHKLNSTSANMILKFLEEPLDGVVAFFITNNLDNVLLTIKSRCQVVNCFYDESINNTGIFEEIVDSIFLDNKYINMFKLKKIYEKYDRSYLINLFNDYLNYCYNNFCIEYKKRIHLINTAINMLNNNVNIDYVLDYLCIEGGSDKWV